MADFRVVDLGRFKMAIDDEDKDVSRQLRDDGWYTDERYETSIFAAQLRPGMTVVDLGANIGFYTMLARSIVGESGRVIAVEPFPASADLIRASMRANGYDNVTVIEAAASDRDGSAPLYLSTSYGSAHSLLDLGHSGHSKSSALSATDVSLRTVDGVMEFSGDSRVDVIKMDIEGGESAALRGMSTVLARNPHLTLMTELWPAGLAHIGSSARAFLETLAAAGFRFQHIHPAREELRAMTLEQIAALVDENTRQRHPSIAPTDDWQGGWWTNLLCTRG